MDLQPYYTHLWEQVDPSDDFDIHTRFLWTRYLKLLVKLNVL